MLATKKYWRSQGELNGNRSCPISEKVEGVEYYLGLRIETRWVIAHLATLMIYWHFASRITLQMKGLLFRVSFSALYFILWGKLNLSKEQLDYIYYKILDNLGVHSDGFIKTKKSRFIDDAHTASEMVNLTHFLFDSASKKSFAKECERLNIERHQRWRRQHCTTTSRDWDKIVTSKIAWLYHLGVTIIHHTCDISSHFCATGLRNQYCLIILFSIDLIIVLQKEYFVTSILHTFLNQF